MRDKPAHYRETIESLEPLWSKFQLNHSQVIVLIFDRGISFLEERLDSESVLRIASSTMYWNWFVREWAVRDWTLCDSVEEEQIIDIDDSDVMHGVYGVFDVMTRDGHHIMSAHQLAEHYIDTHYDSIASMSLPPIFARTQSHNMRQKSALLK